MASRVRVRSRGLAAIMTTYKVKQSSGSKQSDVKQSKEKVNVSSGNYSKNKA